MNNKNELPSPLPKEFKDSTGKLPDEFKKPPETLPDGFGDPPFLPDTTPRLPEIFASR